MMVIMVCWYGDMMIWRYDDMTNYAILVLPYYHTTILPYYRIAILRDYHITASLHQRIFIDALTRQAGPVGIFFCFESPPGA